MRSMSAGPRYYGPKILARDRGEAVRWAVRTLAQSFGGRGTPRVAGRKPARPAGWRPVRWSDARWYSNAPPRRPFQSSREPGCWQPRFSDHERRSFWQPPSVQRTGDWRFRPMPRRGPPVAAVKVPRRDMGEMERERQPRGPEPRGPLRGGPERSAGDPQRKPRDSLRGGPASSSNDTRLSKKTAKR